MTNPYVENLIEMGYDRTDCETVAVAGVDKTFPLTFTGEYIKLKKSMIKIFMILSMVSELLCVSFLLCSSSSSVQILVSIC